MSTNKDFSLEINNFRTWNTKDNPVTMKDDECPVLLNFMPIGQSLYTIPGYTDILASTPDGTTIIRTFDVNINGSLYKMAACSDGSLYKFNSSWTRTLVAAAGTFTGDKTGPRFAQWKYTNLLIIDPKGYWDYDGTTLTKHTTKSAPAAGTCIEVWKGRVWTANGRTLSYSAPDDFTDFQTATSGGIRVDTYASLRNNVVNLLGSQDYLFVTGDHATHIVSGLSILSDGTTDFSLIDAIPGIGTVYPESVCALGDELIFFSDAGVYTINAGSHNLLSSYLDGILTALDTTFAPIGFFSLIYNKLVYCLLVKLTSPLDGTKEKWILCLYEGRWFPVFYGVVGNGTGLDLSFAGQQASSTDTKTYATYENNIIQIFTGASPITKRVRTKYMDYGDSFTDKQILRVGAVIASNLAFIAAFPAVVRAFATTQSASAEVTFPPQTTNWINGFGAPIAWQNGSAQAVTWFGLQADSIGMTTIEGRGKRMALEYDESGANAYVLSGLILDGQLGARW